MQQSAVETAGRTHGCHSFRRNHRLYVLRFSIDSSDAPSVSDNFAPSIARELKSGERLLWQGRPRGGIRLRGNDLFAIPFSLVWCIGIFIAAGAALFGPKKDSAGSLFLIPFVVVGLYLLLGRFFVDATRRRNTAYALTSQRAIIVVDFFGRKVQSINIQALPEVSVTEKSNGSGTIAFGAAQPLRWGRSNPWTGSSSQSAFEMIDDVRRVCDLIDKARNG
jgi:hypothetical protein